MTDIGATLTTTGLIATVVAVFFGMAALYVSHRRRIQSDQNAGVDSPPKKTVSAAPVAAASTPVAPPVPSVVAPLGEPGGAAEGEVNPLWTRSAFSTGQTGSPLFERLGSRKEEPPVAPSPAGKGNEYRWD